MSIPPGWSQNLDFFGTPRVIEPSAGQLSSDAGPLPIRQFDERISPLFDRIEAALPEAARGLVKQARTAAQDVQGQLLGRRSNGSRARAA